MKKAYRIPFVLLALLGIFFVYQAYAAEEAPAGANTGPRYKRMYDPKTVVTISGDVVKVDKIAHRRGRFHTVHLLLKTDKEEIPVHLGPSRYLDEQDVKIGEKDRVEVKGSRIDFRGKPALIAAEVKKGDKILKLRDENGIPAWSRRKTQ